MSRTGRMSSSGAWYEFLTPMQRWARDENRRRAFQQRLQSYGRSRKEPIDLTKRPFHGWKVDPQAIYFFKDKVFRPGDYAHPVAQRARQAEALAKLAKAKADVAKCRAQKVLTQKTKITQFFKRKPKPTWWKSGQKIQKPQKPLSKQMARFTVKPGTITQSSRFIPPMSTNIGPKSATGVHTYLTPAQRASHLKQVIAHLETKNASMGWTPKEKKDYWRFKKELEFILG